MYKKQHPLQIFQQFLNDMFAWIGIPSVVSDNGPAFIYKEFKTFICANVVFHKLMAPYHPASNDHAEQYFHTAKNKRHAMAEEPGDSCRTERI